MALARRPLEYDEAFVTSLVRYGEADCIARLFCKKKGRLSAFVKNGLKPSRTRGGMMQAPMLAKVGLAISPNRDLARLGQIDVDPMSYAVAGHLQQWGWACYLTEIVEIFVPENDAAEQIFDCYKQAFALLAKGQGTPALLRALELKILHHSGYLPDLSGPVDSATDVCVPFDEPARLAALSLFEADLDALPAVEMATLRVVAQIFWYRLKQLSHRPLRSVQFLKSIGV